MKTIRVHTFETNSSACHCLTVIPKDVLEKASHDQYDTVFHFPDTGEYNTDDKYEVMTLEDAMALYNSHVDEYNERYAHIGFHVDKYEHEYEFRAAIEKSEISQDELFGLFMTYGQVMAHAEISTDMKVDITWWNYD